MPNSVFSFSKLIPGGNPTIILHDPALTDGELAAVSARLMEPLHIGAEQVGALFSATAGSSSPPRLRMMGGEFCVNATRAAAMLLAVSGGLTQLPACEEATPVWGGELMVSGMDRPVFILVSPDDAALLAAARACSGPPAPGAPLAAPASGPLLFCAAQVDCAAPGVRCEDARPGVTLVRMPGMSHLLVDTASHPLPALSAWKDGSAHWRESCGLAEEPASGVIWFRREGPAFRIWPAVEVKATHSEHLETACGSASLALALNNWRHSPPEPTGIIQPSGEILRVFPASIPGRAWIAGPVRLAAQGTAYV